MQLGLKNYGFSILELLMAATIGAGIILYLGQYIRINESSNQKVMQDMEDTSSNLNMEAILRKDLTNAKHSLNNLKVKDDNDLLFFDYLSSSSCMSNCTRSIKLDIGKRAGEYSKKSVYFIINNNNAGEQQIYSPADAYTRNTLKFQSLNFENTLSLRVNSPWNPEIKKNSILMFVYSPIEVFDPVDGINVPGKNLSFMGWAGAGNYFGKLIKESITDNGVNYYDNVDLRTKKIISSEDEFFKVMPYTIGLGSFSFVTSVKIVRYRLLTVAEKGVLTGQLIRGEMTSNKKFKELPVGFNIKYLEFSRENISSPAIYIKSDNVK